MKLNNPSLYLYLTTVPMHASGGQMLMPGLGTGFFMDFRIDENKTTRWLITNKHVVQGAAELHMSLHTGNKDANGAITISQNSFDLVVNNPAVITIFHPAEDLCGVAWTELAKAASQNNLVLAAESLSEAIIPSQADLENLSAMEDIITVGYPTAFRDNANNLPILRRGVTASHPGVRFNGECRGVLDIASFGGSSGSPVLVWNEKLVLQDGKVTEQNNRFLLGVQVDGRSFTQDASVVINNAPTNPAAIAKVLTPLHLGNYIRAEALLILKNEIIAQGKFL